MIEYTNFKYVQGPYILFARLLVLAAVPAAFDEGLNVLAFMQNFAPNINKHLSNLWDQRIPLLQHYLEQTKVKQRVLIEMEMKAPVFFFNLSIIAIEKCFTSLWEVYLFIYFSSIFYYFPSFISILPQNHGDQPQKPSIYYIFNLY